MDTEVIKVDPEGGSADAARRAADVLQRGGLVAFSTETVYGVGARADRADSVRRLRTVKSRSPEQAFTVHLGSPDDAHRFAPGLPDLASRFIRKTWPGPLTLILPVDDPSAAPVMAGLNGSAVSAMYYQKSVGLRCPSDRTTQTLLGAVEAPIVAASANLAGHPAPRSGDEVMRELSGRIDLLVDCGPTRYAKPSTIVRVAGSSYELVREGVYDAGAVKRLSTLGLLLVCTGNTCRSPMAAGFAKQLLAKRLGCNVSELKERGITVRSAGTAGGCGGASANAVTVMARRGIDLSDHASVSLTAEMLHQADYIFAMTRGHREAILKMVPSCEKRVTLLLGDRELPDPIGGSIDDYEQCARTVEEGVRARLQEVCV